MLTTTLKEREKLIKSIKTNKEIYLICPLCGRGKLEEGHDLGSKWVCIWRDCPFSTDNIPRIQEIYDLINLKKQLKQIKNWEI